MDERRERVCFVCGQEHRARTRHSREEVTDAINKLKARHPSALLTVEESQHVMNMAIESDEDDGHDNNEQEVL